MDEGLERGRPVPAGANRAGSYRVCPVLGPCGSDSQRSRMKPLAGVHQHAYETVPRVGSDAVLLSAEHMDSGHSKAPNRWPRSCVALDDHPHEPTDHAEGTSNVLCEGTAHHRTPRVGRGVRGGATIAGSDGPPRRWCGASPRRRSPLDVVVGRSGGMGDRLAAPRARRQSAPRFVGERCHRGRPRRLGRPGRPPGRPGGKGGIACAHSRTCGDWCGRRLYRGCRCSGASKSWTQKRQLRAWTCCLRARWRGRNDHGRTFDGRQHFCG